MKSFLVADLSVRGELQLQERYAYEQLEKVPGAQSLIVEFATHIWREPEGFDIKLPGRSDISFRWMASAPSAGIASVRSDEQLASVSILASGTNPEADQLTLRAYQQHLMSELRDTGYEPAFALMDLKDRPMVATINFRSPEAPGDQLAVALADRCFAAAFFRYQGLA